MTARPAQALLSRLNQGDPEALGQIFQTYEPYLRMVIRRQMSARLRAKFDSTDIVQSVWAEIVDGLRHAKWSFETHDQLRAFLVKMTRHRFVDKLRRQRRILKHEMTLPPQDVETLAVTGSPRASECVYAEELWHQMLKLCPPAHYQVLQLKRQGASLDEIAQQTGLHKGSVRRILYQIGRMVARLSTHPQ